MNVGERIKFFRNGKNYSVNKLANLAGISQSYLRDVELGNKNPTVALLSEICEVLGISLKEFFDVESTTVISDDPLIQQIYRLSEQQRESLLTFLKTIP
jgi:transcriptional regulator with XRE-family HTH domain